MTPSSKSFWLQLRAQQARAQDPTQAHPELPASHALFSLGMPMFGLGDTLQACMKLRKACHAGACWPLCARTQNSLIA